MSAWGEGVFENDAAGDWLDQLVASGNSAAIDRALTFAIQARPARLEADEAAAALAAAEVLAAARGHRHADLPADLKEWLADSGYTPTEATVALAVKSVKRVRDDSELADLWAESDALAAWKRGVSGLLDRLAKPAKASRPRKAVAAKSKKPPKPSPRTAIAALKKKGVHVVAKAGAPDWCMGIGGKTDKQSLNDADMQHFLQLETLEELSLTRYQITDTGIRFLAGMTRLRKLELREMPISDASAPVFERMTQVRSLDLSGTRVGDAVLEKVARMKQLHSLSLDQRVAFSPTPGFGIAVSDAGVRHLRACTELAMISLEQTRITDASLKWLSQIPSLRRINIGGTGITSRGIRTLEPLSRLTYLKLQDTAVGDEACATIASFQELDGLSLEGTKVTGAGIRQLTGLKKLDFIAFSRTSLTDDDIPTLFEFPEKATIFVHETEISAKGKRLIAESGRDRINA